MYFLITTTFGLVLVTASIIWWWINQKEEYIFAGKIEGLNDYQKTVSQSLYLKPSYIHIPNTNMFSHDDHFVAVQNEPFKEGQSFDLMIASGENATPETFRIEYTEETHLSYTLDLDPSDGNWVLVPHVATLAPSLDIFAKPAYAGLFNKIKATPLKAMKKNIGNAIEGTKATLPVAKEAKINPLPEIPIHIILQEERSKVSDKISALSKMQGMTDADVVGFLRLKSNKEPLLLTLFDLTRHNDKKVAYLSKYLLDKKINVVDFMYDQLVSGNSSENNLTGIILRLKLEEAEKILEALSKKTDASWIEKLLSKIKKGEIKTKPLIPTGSSSGDRYYVKATWDKKDQNVTTCLTTLFHDALIHDRTLDEEIKLMKNRDKRLVYWYDKQWALGMYGSIEGCKATASFVGF